MYVVSTNKKNALICQKCTYIIYFMQVSYIHIWESILEKILIKNMCHLTDKQNSIGVCPQPSAIWNDIFVLDWNKIHSLFLKFSVDNILERATDPWHLGFKWRMALFGQKSMRNKQGQIWYYNFQKETSGYTDVCELREVIMRLALERDCLTWNFTQFYCLAFTVC